MPKTNIQVDTETLQHLKTYKIHPRETNNQVLQRALNALDQYTTQNQTKHGAQWKRKP